jgi:hypothetical protein
MLEKRDPPAQIRVNQDSILLVKPFQLLESVTISATATSTERADENISQQNAGG